MKSIEVRLEKPNIFREMAEDERRREIDLRLYTEQQHRLERDRALRYIRSWRADTIDPDIKKFVHQIIVYDSYLYRLENDILTDDDLLFLGKNNLETIKTLIIDDIRCRQEEIESKKGFVGLSELERRCYACEVLDRGVFLDLHVIDWFKSSDEVLQTENEKASAMLVEQQNKIKFIDSLLSKAEQKPLFPVYRSLSTFCEGDVVMMHGVEVTVYKVAYEDELYDIIVSDTGKIETPFGTVCCTTDKGGSYREYYKNCDLMHKADYDYLEAHPDYKRIYYYLC